jgi:predicted acylesterase/phospholipase RssA
MKARTALIFAGGVAKGAFGAGAIEVLTARGLRFDRIVGASSGALNAILIAAAVRRGCVELAARQLVELWLEDAHWTRFLDPSVRTIFSARGISDSDRLIELMRAQLAALPTGSSAAVQLRLIVTAIDGVTVTTVEGPATTFEDVRRFESSDFDTDEGLEAVIRAAAASAAFPGLFAPVALPPHGPAVDGGVVSNAPIKEAVADGDIDRVFVIIPYPALDEQRRAYQGTELAARLVEILIQERLFRDLREAAERNRSLAALGALVHEGRLESEQLRAVLASIGWQRARPLEIIPIRPAHPLDGGTFSGFFDRSLRTRYVEQGRDAARTALSTAAGELRVSD